MLFRSSQSLADKTGALWSPQSNYYQRAADAELTKHDVTEKTVTIDEVQAPQMETVDLVKSVIAELTNDKSELRDEIRKALGLDEEMATTKAALAEATESVKTLKAAYDELREMAAPGGPVLRQTTVQANKSARVTALNVEAERLRMTASNLIDPNLRNQYLAEANRLDLEAEAL